MTSFDAYGKRREVDWSNDADNSTFGDNQWLERGYTGHEHLDNVRMIHMNGRVQDPIWGRMLSPDPAVGDRCLLRTTPRKSWDMGLGRPEPPF